MVWPVSWITLCTIFTTCSAFDLLPHLRIVSVASDSSSAVTAGFRNFMMPTVSPFDLFSFLKNTPNLALITVPKIKVCASFAWYMRLMTLTGGTPEAGLTATPSFKDRLRQTRTRRSGSAQYLAQPHKANTQKWMSLAYSGGYRWKALCKRGQRTRRRRERTVTRNTHTGIPKKRSPPPPQAQRRRRVTERQNRIYHTRHFHRLQREVNREEGVQISTTTKRRNIHDDVSIPPPPPVRAGVRGVDGEGVETRDGRCATRRFSRS